MKHNILSLRLPLFMWLSACLLLFVSCGGDEPEWNIGYYLSIQSQVQLSLSEEDNNQGTSPDQTVNVLSTTVRLMRAALQDAYPEETHKGNDAAVIAACDKIYRDYKEAYADKEGHIVCVLKLYRTKKDGDIVRESTALTTYHFGALPQDSNRPS